MSSDGGRATPSTLMYLFADRVSPRDKALTEGIEVPCQGFKVQKRPLAGMMFAAAFLNLRDLGLISLQVEQRKVLFVKTKKVVAAPLAPPQQRPGLEGAVLQGMTRLGQPNATVGDIIRKWFNQDVTGPWDDVIAEAVEEAAMLGCFEWTEVEGRGRIAKKLLGTAALKPVCERIAQYGPSADAFFARWQEFQAHETPLYSELIDECASAIRSRQETDHDDDFD